MKINKVIRTHRKEQNLTQEQLANYLGVSTPAVNKWENGISFPDITLLAPLARILKINLDTLLSFREELSDLEIQEFIRKISGIMQKEGFEKAFEEGERLIIEYPSCEKLVMFLTQILYMYLSMSEISADTSEAGKELYHRYEVRILSWFESVVNGGEENIASMAAASLCQIYISKKEFDKAQHLLDEIPAVGFDKRTTQASLFANMGMNEKAYEIYETIIYKSASELCQILQIIANMYYNEGKLEESGVFTNLLDQAAELFGLGSFMSIGQHLNMAIKKQDREESLNMLEKMIEDSFQFQDKIKGSMIYTHVKFNAGPGNMKEVHNMFKKMMENDHELDFMKNDPRFEKLLDRMDKAINS